MEKAALTGYKGALELRVARLPSHKAGSEHRWEAEGRKPGLAA